MQHKLYRDIKLKPGKAHSILPKGAVVDVFPIPGKPGSLAVVYEHVEYKIGPVKVFRPPSERVLNHWVFDSVCESLLGCQVEPDGYDDKGFPSWLLALGLI